MMTVPPDLVPTVHPTDGGGSGLQRLECMWIADYGVNVSAVRAITQKPRVFVDYMRTDYGVITRSSPCVVA